MDCNARRVEGIDKVELGKTVRVCCPFHGEKTPSLLIKGEEIDASFHCLGCSARGSAFRDRGGYLLSKH